MNNNEIIMISDNELDFINGGFIPVVAGAMLVGLGVGFSAGFNAMWNYLNTPPKMCGDFSTNIA